MPVTCGETKERGNDDEDHYRYDRSTYEDDRIEKLCNVLPLELRGMICEYLPRTVRLDILENCRSNDVYPSTFWINRLNARREFNYHSSSMSTFDVSSSSLINNLVILSICNTMMTIDEDYDDYYSSINALVDIPYEISSSFRRRRIDIIATISRRLSLRSFVYNNSYFSSLTLPFIINNTTTTTTTTTLTAVAESVVLNSRKICKQLFRSRRCEEKQSSKSYQRMCKLNAKRKVYGGSGGRRGKK